MYSEFFALVFSWQENRSLYLKNLLNYKLR